MTNGPVEGINNKLRVITRRAYGFHSHGAPSSRRGSHFSRATWSIVFPVAGDEFGEGQCEGLAGEGVRRSEPPLAVSQPRP